jgi:hypothetical protein
MREIVNGRAAAIHREAAGFARLKFLDRAGAGIKQLQSHGRGFSARVAAVESEKPGRSQPKPWLRDT